MILCTNEYISKAFGANAKFLDLSERNLKSIIFMSSSNKLSRYDEIHIGRFIGSGMYMELFKKLQKEIGLKNRMVFQVEYGILKVCVIRKGKDGITLLKSFTVGLFYGRNLEEIFMKAKKAIAQSLLLEVQSSSERVNHFLELFKKHELSSKDAVEKSIDLYEDITGTEIQNREVSLIKKYVNV